MDLFMPSSMCREALPFSLINCPLVPRQRDKETPLSVRSLKYLKLEEMDFHPFISVFKHVPLKRQSVITAMTSLKKSHVEDDAVSCLVAASENGDVYILDPEAFTVLKQVCIYFLYTVTVVSVVIALRF